MTFDLFSQKIVSRVPDVDNVYAYLEVYRRFHFF